MSNFAHVVSKSDNGKSCSAVLVTFGNAAVPTTGRGSASAIPKRRWPTDTEILDRQQMLGRS